MKKTVEKEGGKKKEMITVEVKNGSSSPANSKRLWRSRLRKWRRKRRRHPPLQMRLGRCVECGKQCKNLYKSTTRVRLWQCER
jgi:hypothetical protein